MAFTKKDLALIEDTPEFWTGAYKVALNKKGEIELQDLNHKVITTIREEDLNKNLNQRLNETKEQLEQDQIISQFLTSICRLIKSREQLYKIKLFDDDKKQGYLTVFHDGSWTVSDDRLGNLGINHFTKEEVELIKKEPKLKCINWHEVTLEKAGVK